MHFADKRQSVGVRLFREASVGGSGNSRLDDGDGSAKLAQKTEVGVDLVGARKLQRKLTEEAGADSAVFGKLKALRDLAHASALQICVVAPDDEGRAVVCDDLFGGGGVADVKAYLAVARKARAQIGQMVAEEHEDIGLVEGVEIFRQLQQHVRGAFEPVGVNGKALLRFGSQRYAHLHLCQL